MARIGVFELPPPPPPPRQEGTVSFLTLLCMLGNQSLVRGLGLYLQSLWGLLPAMLGSPCLLLPFFFLCQPIDSTSELLQIRDRGNCVHRRPVWWCSGRRCSVIFSSLTRAHIFARRLPVDVRRAQEQLNTDMFVISSVGGCLASLAGMCACQVSILLVFRKAAETC